MKCSSRYSISLVLMLMIGCSCKSQDSAVTLRRTFKQGSSENFHIVVQMKQTAPFPVPGGRGTTPRTTTVTTSSELTQTIEKVSADNTSADVTTKQSGSKVETDDPATRAMLNAMMQQMNAKEVNAKGKLDNRNMMSTTFDAASLRANPMLGLASEFGLSGKPLPNGVEFPELPVRKGDTWSSKQTGMEALGGKGELKNTFLGASNVDSVAAWHIQFEGHFPIDGASRSGQAVPFGAVLDKMKGNIDIKGDAFLDQRDCSIVSVTTTTRTSMTMPVKTGTEERPLDLTQEQTITKTRTK